MKKNPPEIKIGEPVDATKSEKVCTSCVYGRNHQGELGLCRFMECTGKPRILICPPEACTVYERVTKENPRRRSLFF